MSGQFDLVNVPVQGGVVGDPAALGIDGRRLAGLVDVARRFVGVSHHGAQIVVARNGVRFVDLAIGWETPDQPMRADLLMHWYSSSKPLTAMAIAQQVDRGKLALDAPVAAYIPEFGNGRKAPATVRHVLRHEGGFPMWPFRPGENLAQMDWDDAVALVAREPGDWEPGAQRKYHPMSGWIILGELVRRVDGRRIDAYLADEIFGPLDMRDASLGLPREKQWQLAARISHVRSMDRPWRATDLSSEQTIRGYASIAPGFAGWGSARDLATFHAALTTGMRVGSGALVKPDTLAEFMGRGPGGSPLGFHPVRYGTPPDPDGIGHGGGGFNQGWCEPNDGLAYAYLTNGSVGAHPDGPEAARALHIGRFRELGGLIRGALVRG